MPEYMSRATRPPCSLDFGDTVSRTNSALGVVLRHCPTNVLAVGTVDVVCGGVVASGSGSVELPEHPATSTAAITTDMRRIMCPLRRLFLLYLRNLAPVTVTNKVFEEARRFVQSCDDSARARSVR